MLRDLGRGWQGLVLRTDRIELVLLPEKGCDLYALTDVRTGIDVLFKAPWGLPARDVPSAADSQAAWLERYPGGWQLLVPNGGAESGSWGFHGEACLLPWAIESYDESGAKLSTRLFRAPLAISRAFRLHDATVTLDETVTNTSPDPVEFMWSHHPAFGAPFVEAGCRLTTGARELVADDEAPGTMLAPGSRHPWPAVVGEDDLSVLPGPDQRRSQLAYLTGFDEGRYTISNDRLGLGVEVTWPLDVFPNAWFWQEIHSTPGFPWWREAYVCAVEPASTIPGQGVEQARAKGGSLVGLAGGESRSVRLTARLFATEEEN